MTALRFLWNSAAFTALTIAVFVSASTALRADVDFPPPDPTSLRGSIAAKTGLTPPPAKDGCYENAGKGWVEKPCATDKYIKEHLPPPVLQYAILSDPQSSGGTTNAAQSLVFGSVWDYFVSVGSITDTINGPNAFSIQNNSNLFVGNNGHTDGVQFTIQVHPGNPDSVCIWQIDVSKQNYNNTVCNNYTHVRSVAGLLAGDYAIVDAWVLPGGKLSVAVQVPWSGVFEGLTTADAFGLAGNWTEVSGGPLGWGTPLNSTVPAILDFSNATVSNNLAASTCSGPYYDYNNVANPCPNQTPFKPSASITKAGYPLAGTFEGNNLRLPSPPTLVWPNVDYVEIQYLTKVPPPAAPVCKVTTQCGTEDSDAFGEISCTGSDVGIYVTGQPSVGHTGASSVTASLDFSPANIQACSSSSAGSTCIQLVAKAPTGCPPPGVGTHQCDGEYTGDLWCSKVDHCVAPSQYGDLCGLTPLPTSN
jgi:hypothetical protein